MSYQQIDSGIQPTSINKAKTIDDKKSSNDDIKELLNKIGIGFFKPTHFLIPAQHAKGTQ